jgi:hypothetical protein
MSIQTNHNLNIHMYSFTELLELFNLPEKPTIEDMKRAKKQVLMVHPDKSKLPPEYFLFYKKAFDVVVQFYESNNKQNQKMDENTTKYDPTTGTEIITKTINDMPKETFQNKFNELFEENMINKEEQEKIRQRNEWFSKNDPLYQINETVSSKNMGEVINNIKKTNHAVIRYEGVQEFQNNGFGSRLYDNEEKDDSYASCDPFSKLKFDDLRRVHKDQTVFAVSENDFEKVKQYTSVDHFVKERDGQIMTPFEKTEAERMLAHREKKMKENINSWEYQEKLKTMQYAEKNKKIMSTFLQLE